MSIKDIKEYVDTKSDLEYIQHMCYDHHSEDHCHKEADAETKLNKIEQKLKDSLSRIIDLEKSRMETLFE